MATDEYVIRWNNYADGFPIGFRESLQLNEFVDVTLTADGHFFGAHRLILSSLSPYFRDIFNHMPTNQQTCSK